MCEQIDVRRLAIERLKVAQGTILQKFICDGTPLSASWHIIDRLFAEIDRLNALLKVDWIPVDEVKLCHEQRYWLSGIDEDAVTIEGKKSKQSLGIWDDFYASWEDEIGNEVWFTITHVAEFKYPDPPSEVSEDPACINETNHKDDKGGSND